MKTKDSVAEEALSCIGGLNSGLDICMGVGKTRIGLKDMESIMDVIDNPTFLIVCKGPVEPNWIQQATEYNKDILKHISFCTYSSLSKCVTSLKYTKVYFDECHNITEKHVPVLDYFRNNKIPILGLTGTYPIKPGIKLEICQTYFPLKYQFTIDQAVENRIVNNYVIYVHKIRLSNEMNIVMKAKLSGKTWVTSEERQYTYYRTLLNDYNSSFHKGDRSRMAMSAIKKFESKVDYVKKLLEYRNKKMLIFANNKEQANKLSKHVVHSGIGKIIAESNLNKFKTGEIELLAAVEQLSEGINIPNLGSIIIMHSYSNPRLFLQKLGRVLRLDPSQTAKIHLLCYKDTIDEAWVESCLSVLDKSKVKYVNV